MRPATLRSIVYLAGGIGLVLSVFAAVETLSASAQAFCSVNSFLSCSRVDMSGRTSTLGLTDWAWGVGGFVGILVLAAVGERTHDRRYDWALLWWISFGVALSAYLAYVELAEIGALCLVCFGTYVANFAAWIAAIGLVRSPFEEFTDESLDPGYAESDETVVV